VSESSEWSVERLEARVAELAPGSRELETIRESAEFDAYQSDKDRPARLRWAKLSLAANRKLQCDSSRDRAGMLTVDFMLRTWIIERVGPDDADPDWNPEALAADTLAALTLDPGQADAASTSWQTLPIEQIRELRRHKNLTRHLDRLIGYLPPGPGRAQLSAWCEVRGRLP